MPSPKIHEKAILKKSSDFINQIKEIIQAGGRFTPFLGAGISAQSGILMGQEFPNYIAYTVYRVLGGPAHQDASSPPKPDELEYWDIRARGWPPYPTSLEIDHTYQFLVRKYKSLVKDRWYVDTDDSTPERPTIKELKLLHPAATFPNTNLADVDLIRVLVPTILRSGSLWHSESRLDEQRRHLGIKDEPADANTPSSSMSYIVESAIRSLSHWTRTLEFLSKVALAEDQRLYLDSPDIAVIDSFNAYITRGKKPNLIHNMISRLARSLRSQIVLTTNFDTLIEESYRAQGEPLHVLAVSIKGGLPSYATVRAQDCLIKLHGDILETRADSTINDPPSEKDKRLFFQYLRGPKGPKLNKPFDFIPSNLLVLGYSGGDARCVQMIKFVMDLDPEFRVFWVCHGDNDLSSVTKVFHEYMVDRYDKEGQHMLPQITLYQSDRTDLLLWELYQQINLSLPGGGYSVQFSHFVPPLSPERELSQQEEKATKELAEWIEERTRSVPSKKPAERVICIDVESGTTLPMQSAFYHLRKKYDAVWMELEDYSSTDDFFFHIHSIIAQRIGQFQLEWTSFIPASKNGRFDTMGMSLRMRLLVEKFKINPGKWFVFLYGRNGAGGCTGWSKNPSYWSNDEFKAFERLLIDMAAAGFRIVYMPHGAKRHEHTLNKVNDICDLAKNRFKLDALTKDEQEHLMVPEHAAAQILKPSDDALFRNLIAKFERKEKRPFMEMIHEIINDFVLGSNQAMQASRALWLYGLTLFRQSRHPSALMSEAVFSCPWRFAENRFQGSTRTNIPLGRNQGNSLRDNDEMREWLIYQSSGSATARGPYDSIDLEGWLNYLERVGLFMRKPGGYAWMYRDSRLGLQALLNKLKKFKFCPAPFSQDSQHLILDSLSSRRAALHYWIGDWYLRAFYSTSHYTPLIESIYHSVQCLNHVEGSTPLRKSKTVDSSKRDHNVLTLSWKAVCQLRRLILVGRKSLLFWCPGMNVISTFFGFADRASLDKWFLKTSRKTRKSNAPLASLITRGLNELHFELLQLDEAVKSEGYAHGGRTAPFVASSMIERRKPLSIIEHPTEHIDQIDWAAKICDAISDKASLSPADRAQMLKFGNSKWDMALQKSQQDWSALKKDLFKGCLQQKDVLTRTFDVAWLVSELMYRTARRAKLEYHAGERKSITSKWKTICALGSMGLELCRMLPPDFHAADCDLRVRIFTVYALALSYLNRFSEASRRFNEAHALIISGMETTNGRELARIHIRRAEMLVWRAKNQLAEVKSDRSGSKAATATVSKSSDNSTALALVYIDDAWTALERGEIGLAGISHATYWWYRLIALRLSCYAVLGKLRKRGNLEGLGHCLPFRRRLHLPSYLTSLVRDGLILGAGDRFRQLRVMEYALDADLLLAPQNKLFGDNETAGFLVKQSSLIQQMLADIYRVVYPTLGTPLQETYRNKIYRTLSNKHEHFMSAAKLAEGQLQASLVGAGVGTKAKASGKSKKAAPRKKQTRTRISKRGSKSRPSRVGATPPPASGTTAVSTRSKRSAKRKSSTKP